jgi:[phosphatase 2A protein]-leucine-carboxy methyltransferase
MAAPQIPNLLSGLRRGGRGGRGGARGRGDSSGRGGLFGRERSAAPSSEDPRAPAAPRSAAARHELLVQGTDGDASVSRMSAVQCGYLVDPFAEYFTPQRHGPVAKRFPIINRGMCLLQSLALFSFQTELTDLIQGTYVRTTAIDRLVATFLGDNPLQQKQIISLGAGSDTRYFRFHEILRKQQSRLNDEHAAKAATDPTTSSTPSPQIPDLVYHELDFPAITKHKLDVILQSRALASPDSPFCNNPTAGGGSIQSPSYNLHPIDLRALPMLPLANLRSDIPTLLISECCLCYLEPAEAERVMDYFLRLIPNIGIVLYEPQLPNDAFGQTMTSNLATRGLSMPTVKVYTDLGKQRERLLKAGFEGADGGDVDWLWEKWVSGGEKERVSRLEMLDEVEEWQLLGRHYLIVWAWREDGQKGDKGAFNGWARHCHGQTHVEPIRDEMDIDGGSDTA